MKKSSRLSVIGAGFAMALMALAGTAPKSIAYVNNAHTRAVKGVNENVATEARQAVKQYRTVHHAGGLDLLQKGDFGMSPKEYGQKIWCGKSRKGKTNFNRLSHNAKLKRR